MFALATIVSVAFAAPPTKCTPGPTFEASGEIHVEEGSTRARGAFRWAHDMAVKKAAEEFRFPDPGHRRFEAWALEDYAMHTRYEENNTDRKCEKEPLQGDIPMIWSWLADATYRGERHIRNRTVEIWGGKAGNVDLEMGCATTDISRPVGLFVNTTTRRTLMMFDHYMPNVSNTRVFNPLPNCN